MSLHPRAETGQASLEWLALVAAVGVLLAFGAALAEAGYLGRRVTREMARAMCVVSRGDCARDREPCVTGSEHGRQALTLHLFLLRLGTDTATLVEQRSDGTVALTVVRGWTAGVEAAAGLRAGVDLGGVHASVDAELQAAELARRHGGRTWIVPSMAAARGLLGRLGLGRGGAPRPPDLTSGDVDLVSSLRGAVGADALVHLDVAGGGLTFDRHAGVRVDHRSGHRTVTVDATWGAEASAGGQALGVLGGEAEHYAVEFDAAGRPLDLQVATTGRYAGSRDLPGVVQPVAGLLAADDGLGERAVEVTAHLDLTDADNLAAARGLLAALAGPRLGGAPRASQALRRRIDARGSVEARVLAEDGSTRALGADGGLGGRLGGEVQVASHSVRLLAAASRGLDGRWLPREDCVG